jgi:hypothetical protein
MRSETAAFALLGFEDCCPRGQSTYDFLFFFFKYKFSSGLILATLETLIVRLSPGQTQLSRIRENSLATRFP